jgi:hypothetical protein
MLSKSVSLMLRKSVSPRHSNDGAGPSEEAGLKCEGGSGELDDAADSLSSLHVCPKVHTIDLKVHHRVNVAQGMTLIKEMVLKPQHHILDAQNVFVYREACGNIFYLVPEETQAEDGGAQGISVRVHGIAAPSADLTEVICRGQKSTIPICNVHNACRRPSRSFGTIMS